MFVQGIFGENIHQIGVSSIESLGIDYGSQSHQLNSKSLMLSLTIGKNMWEYSLKGVSSG
jgi:putative NADPH-quinone reductase